MKATTAIAVLATVFLAALILDARAHLTEHWQVTSETLVPVSPGSNIRYVLQDIEQKGLIKYGRSWVYASIYLRIKGLGGSVRAGEYLVRPGTTTLDFLAQITSGRSFFHQITLIEGWRFSQALAAIQAHPAVRRTLNPSASAEIMRRLDSAGVPAEGSVLPETYHFARGVSDLSLLRQARQAMKKTLEQEWARRDAGLPYKNPMEALVMASIVEKETGRAAERPEIAGVFVRRLQRRMRLQTDPTVIYGLGERFDGNLRRSDLRRDTPYNTYTRYGLPPTPICLPGRAAVQAALRPQAGDTLYFVARGDGSHVFSATLAEHNQAVNEYQIKPARQARVAKKKT